MAKNNFKPFAIGTNANVTNQTDYESLTALTSGFQSGKASSAQINKALRQATFVSSAIAQFMSDKLNQDVLDNGDLPAFNLKMLQAFASQYLSRTSPFSDIKSDGATAVTTALSNLGIIMTQGATFLTVRFGALIIMCGNNSGTTTNEGNLSASFPFSFPNAVFYLNMTQANPTYAADTNPLIFSPYNSPSGPVTSLGCCVRNSKTDAAQSNTFVNSRYIAIGY